MKQDIVVLGGGVIGICTALVCRALGYEVELMSRRFIWEPAKDPMFASLYPAASVIPHSVGGNTKTLYQHSHSVYTYIAHQYPELVRPQMHLEIGECEQELKDYFDWMAAKPIAEEPGLPVPRRAGADRIYGVRFDMLFVDMPRYIPFLHKMVLKWGIQTTHKELTRGTAKALAEQGRVVCNCLGYYGPALVEDSSPMQGVAGILVRFPQKHLLKNAVTKTPISYNYLFEGVEVYAYPRGEDIVFGGIRIPVDANEDPAPQLKAHFESRDIRYTDFNSVPVPDYLIEVNQAFTHQLYGIDVEAAAAEAVVGIRPVRKAGVRLDAQTTGAAALINSYGYGGAGVTLAWGAALKAASLVDGRNEAALSQAFLEVF